MNRKFFGMDLKNSFWGKVVVISMVLFFVYLGDAILSDWVPAYIQTAVSSSFLMGMIISFSSMVGFLADVVFPQILKGVKTRKLIVMAIGASLMFCGVLIWSIPWPWIFLFLLAMAIWGVYYEFLSFGKQGFVSENIPATARSGAWAIIGTFQSLAYFLGPIIGSWLTINRSNSEVVLAAAFFVIIGYLFWLISGREKSESVVVEEAEKLNIWEEIKHWRVLFDHVWPVLTISLMLGVVDATFWTTGTVLSDTLAKNGFWGGMFLPMYTLPMIFMGVVVAKWGIYKGKKKTAEVFLLLAGVLLSLVGWSDKLWFLLLIAFGVGATLSISWPMTDAVYSDIVSRMGREGKHLMGLSSSTISLAYIVGPILVGFVASKVGEIRTFGLVGMLMVVVATVLLLVTPKKLRLPQEEIQKWD